MAKHRLTWRAGRRTPIVTPVGKRTRPAKKGEGKVVKSRRATAAEERQIAKGTWVRVAKNGSKPGSKAYAKTGSRVRPKLKPKVRKKR